jgi:tRNA (cytidine/uridine-2'-O-)-methyltransferase
MRLCLYQPDIAQNAGTLLRLAACMAVPVDLIGPAGFDMSDRAFRRAGMDYLAHVELARHDSWAAFRQTVVPPARLVLLTSKAATNYLDFAFQTGDILMLGRESAGVPDHVHAAADARIGIAMHNGLRSLNVAVAGAMVLGEAQRQVRTESPLPVWPVVGTGKGLG